MVVVVTVFSLLLLWFVVVVDGRLWWVELQEHSVADCPLEGEMGEEGGLCC